MTDRASNAEDPASEPPVLYEVKSRVATVTLNRPHRRNAISMAMLNLLAKHLAKADDDPGVRVVVLTGAGKGFCAGLDVKDAATGSGIGGSAGGRDDQVPGNPRTRGLPTTILQQMNTPVIGALNGAAAGYGFDLALGCDLRLMAASAEIIPGFATVGVVPESGGTWYLPRLVGWAKAAEIAFLGRSIPAEEAARLGLVNRTVPDDELARVVEEWAAEIAANAPLAVSATKRLFRHGQAEDFDSHTHHVLLQMWQLMQTRDFREGVAAVVERRRPQFTGA